MGSLISCDKKEGAQSFGDISKGMFANAASVVLSELLECSKKEQINNDVRSIMGLNNKSLDLGSLFPCVELVSGILPQILKDSVVPSSWECKPTRIDLSLDRLAEKICN